MLHYQVPLASHPRDHSTGFTLLERRVIALARDEAPVTAPEPGLRACVAAWLRPLPRPRPLANERLEALRRLASDLWHGQDAVGSGNLALFRAAGFADGHLALLLDLAEQRELGHVA